MEWGREGGLDGGEPEASTQQGWAESRPPAATRRWKMATEAQATVITLL